MDRLGALLGLLALTWPQAASPRVDGDAGGERVGGPRQGPDGPDDDLETVRRKLYDKVKATFSDSKLHEDEIQYELGCWIRLLDTTEEQFARASRPREALQRLVRQAEAAIEALLSPNPELVFARTLRYRAEMDLQRYGGRIARFLARLSDSDPAVFVGTSVFLTLAFGVGVYVVSNLLPAPLLVMPWDGATTTVLQAAFLGGGVSVLVRLREFSCAKVRDFNPFLLFSNALFNPFVAMISAAFVYAVLTSGLLLPLENDLMDKIVQAPWVIGFLSGFSERFTSDIIARTETVLGGKK